MKTDVANPDTLKPEKLTKPIQVLGAWLAGLLSLDSCFLIAAVNLQETGWLAASLVLASIANVPLFLFAVFVLQTRFRPELQEDSYYATYLSKKTDSIINVDRDEAILLQMRRQIEELEKVVSASTSPEASSDVLDGVSISINKHLVNRSDIRKRLSSLGAFPITSFGTSESPQGKYLAISKYLSKSTVRLIVEIAEELGFTHYTTYDSAAEESEDILFGSYGSAEVEIP